MRGAQRAFLVLVVAVVGCISLCGGFSSAWAVSPAQPTINTNASGSVVAGDQVSDRATVTGGTSPTGTVTFRLYWPSDPMCMGTPAFSSTNPVNAGAAASDSFTPSAAGTYRWTASYSGDANNVAAAGACNDANETVSVDRTQPTITTNASGTVALGGQVNDTATVGPVFHGSLSPYPCISPVACFSPPAPQSIVYSLYGPEDFGCTGAPVFISRRIDSRFDDFHHSAPYTPTVPGTYRWTTSYSGDINNQPAAGECNAPNESVLVTAGPGPSPPPDTTRPLLSALVVSPASFRAAKAGPSIASVVGAKVSYALLERASVTLTVERRLFGRHVHGGCVRPKHSNRRAKRCVRYMRVGASFIHQGQPGANHFRFTGRLRSRKLAPGRYRLRAEAKDPAGNQSPPKASQFRIILH
ncbi:MAG: Ig-like domain-containing protein [Actinomycetota bacterium]|nr:Ig-like domain-containing protein [Actinomycetota bacterium]